MANHNYRKYRRYNHCPICASIRVDDYYNVYKIFGIKIKEERYLFCHKCNITFRIKEVD